MPRRRGSQKSRKSVASRPDGRYSGEMQLSWIPPAIVELFGNGPRHMKMIWGYAQQGEKFFLENSTKDQRNGHPYPSFAIMANIGFYVKSNPDHARDLVSAYITGGPRAVIQRA